MQQAKAMLKVTALMLTAVALARQDEVKERRIVEAFKDIPGFLWGTATAAYQVEGAWDKDGRQQSIWDHFTREKGQGHVWGNETGDRADDFYHKWSEDLMHLGEFGFNSFRMSISWPRIYPRGEDGVHRPNPKGIEFYKAIVYMLLDFGVVPAVTIYHWDLPDDYDWLNDTVVDAFVDYSDFLFKTFPEIHHWITFNEPLTFCPQGYGDGSHAPGVKSPFKQYICGHNVLRAHARAVKNFRDNYQKKSTNATIGITLNYEYAYPWNASEPADVQAAQFHHDFRLGWWADPVFLTGDYPPSMRRSLGEHLPEFTEEEKSLLKGSADFFGMNIYSGIYAKAAASPSETYPYVTAYRGSDGKLIGPKAGSPWLYVVPDAMRKYLVYVHERYSPKAIYVTENGCDVPGEGKDLSVELNDTFREDYYRDYLAAAAEAVTEDKVPLKGYYAWSLLDNFEWADGYHFRFGLTYVNYTTQMRTPKRSGKWFKELLKRMGPEVKRGEHGQREDEVIVI